MSHSLNKDSMLNDRRILNIGDPTHKVDFKPFKYEIGDYALVLRESMNEKYPKLWHGKIETKFSSIFGDNLYDIINDNIGFVADEESIILVCEDKK